MSTYLNTRHVTGYDFDNDTQILTFTDAIVEPDGVMYIVNTQMMHFKDKIVKEKLIEIGWTPSMGGVSWFDIKEESKLDTKATIVKAFKQAYSLGQTYWAQADSDYSSQWKKADATEAKFDTLVKEIEQLLDEKL